MRVLLQAGCLRFQDLLPVPFFVSLPHFLFLVLAFALALTLYLFPFAFFPLPSPLGKLRKDGKNKVKVGRKLPIG
ncbi:MAG: hypothetical protein D6679_12145 [Candidatus Hydrogenedentota bacterium]|nr:MAG: hypothetical protein D6679_12145 [Candidatus Hydrogenedentota bacterium]